MDDIYQSQFINTAQGHNYWFTDFQWNEVSQSWTSNWLSTLHFFSDWGYIEDPHSPAFLLPLIVLALSMACWTLSCEGATSHIHFHSFLLPNPPPLLPLLHSPLSPPPSSPPPPQLATTDQLSLHHVCFWIYPLSCQVHCNTTLHIHNDVIISTGHVIPCDAGSHFQNKVPVQGKNRVSCKLHRDHIAGT